MVTAIEWTDATWNPTTGCDRVSTGCDHCYALRLSKRLKAMGQHKYQNDGDPRTSGPGFGVAVHEEALKLPFTWARPRKVFVNSMSDLFHPRVPLDFVQRVFEVIVATPQHRYQVLTKRPLRARRLSHLVSWPSNLWLGTSIENDEIASRADELRRTPAAIRFLSLEPLLGPLPSLSLADIDWVIVGGESGPEARPMESGWVEDLLDRCQAEQVPFFFKQWGGATPKAGGRLLRGRVWDEYPRAVAGEGRRARG